MPMVHHQRETLVHVAGDENPSAGRLQELTPQTGSSQLPFRSIIAYIRS